VKRILLGLVIGLALLEVGRRLDRPADAAAAAGLAAYNAGDFARAEARFRQAEQGAPDPSVAAANRAAALYRLARLDDADQTYQRSADGNPAHAARAAYDRGNCAFGKACAEEGTAEPALLEQAAALYEACLALEDKTPPAGLLFDDARHNLELAKLILAEFADPAKANAESAPADPDKTAPDPDDPFAPANAAHSLDRDGQPKPAEGEKTAPKAEQKDQQAKECKECKREGCPKCKKNPGKGPGPLPSPSIRGDGPKPNPGQADNGQARGKGKSPKEAKNPDPGPGQGKPGAGGK